MTLDFAYSTNGNDLTITSYTGTNINITIPSSVDGYRVVGIGIRAFASCTNLVNVTIGGNITSIERSAFSGCYGLTNVTIGKGVNRISDYVFLGCFNLKSVNIPTNVTSIGEGAFAGCTSLATVTIPDSVTFIGYGAFSGCTRLTDVTIGNSVTSIDEDAFRSCSSLTRVFFKSNAPSIGDYAFDGDTKATVYYLAGTTGWSSTFGGLPTVMVTIPTLAISSHGTNVIVSWSKGILLETTNVAVGPWVTNTAISPFTNTPGTNAPLRFYRVLSN